MVRICEIVHSYTLEFGYHSNNFIFELPEASNTTDIGYVEDDIENFKSSLYKKGPPTYTIPIFH